MPAPEPASPGAARQLLLLRRAFGIYTRAAPAHAVTSWALMVLDGVAPVALAWFSRVLIDGLTAGDVTEVRRGVAGVVGLGLVIAVLNHVSRFVDQEISRRVAVRTQLDLFTAVSAQPGLAALEDARFHDRLRLAREASQFAPMQLTGSVMAIVSAGITVVGFAATIVARSPLIGVLVLLAGVPTLVAQLRLARQRSQVFVDTSPMFRRQEFYGSLLLDMRAAKEIRLYGLADFFRGRMVRELRAAQAAERRHDVHTMRVDGLLAVLAAVVSAVALGAFVAQVLAGDGTAGELVLLIAALTAVQGSLGGVVMQLAAVAEMLIMFDHYVRIVDDRPPVDGDAAAPPPLRTLELDDVWFRYAPEHPWILRGVSLTLVRGESLALVGENGAGKSTVVKLLCGFYTPTRGAIRWNGTDLRELDPAQVRSRLGATFQDFMTYELSATDNIAVGDLAGAEDRAGLEAAAAEAGIHTTLAALPHGYDTLLTRSFDRMSGTQATDAPGVVLSGGQWQRVALARSVLRRSSDLLILDEPSAGLDVHAEHELQTRLASLRTGRASLLISHRLNTVRDADVIAVLHEGAVVERGGHDELMRQDGRYAAMFRLQAAGYADSAPAADS